MWGWAYELATQDLTQIAGALRKRNSPPRIFFTARADPKQRSAKMEASGRGRARGVSGRANHGMWEYRMR